MKQKFLTAIFAIACGFAANAETLWQIGEDNGTGADLALGPSGYKEFVSHDFGFEDRYFIIGHSSDKNDFPYILPGPEDEWAGTCVNSGWRTHEINILFNIAKLPKKGDCRLVLDLVDAHPVRSLVKVTVNDIDKKFDVKGEADESAEGDLSKAKEQKLIFEFPVSALRKNGNMVKLAVLEGSWILFDQVKLEVPDEVKLGKNNSSVFVREVKTADYELSEEGKCFQPLLVDVEHLNGNPQLEVRLDGKTIYTAAVDSARYIFEAPMPAVNKKVNSRYEVLADNEVMERGVVTRSPQHLQTPADYVDTKIGSAHSRWMIAPGPWMPFSMVKLSPDNQNAGWQAGYQPTFETIGCFSHIHEWTMGGLGIMPTNGPLMIKPGDQFRPDEGYRSRIDKRSEKAPLGSYSVKMSDTGIFAETTATERCSFMRFTFPKDKEGRVMVDLHIQAEYDYLIKNVTVKQVGDRRLEGSCHQFSAGVWSNDADQEYTLNFVMEFDAPIKNIGGWKNNDTFNESGFTGKNLTDAGMFVEFDTKLYPTVQVRTGISFVSIANAAENLKKEISDPFGWSYESVVQNQKNVWNDIFNRVKVSGSDRYEKIRFYTNMFRGLSRNMFSDINGEWISADGKVQKFSNPEHAALGCDAFWNSFWNLNIFWNLVTPEWSSKWANSQLAMYDANGWLAKGPAGMKYIPVMVAEHEIPFIVSAWQMGIRDFDAEKAFEAMKKMQTTPSRKVEGGYAGNRDLIPYMQYHYVPIEKGRFSNTMEYSYDDWTVGQMAKALGKYSDYKVFNDRGYWWKNAINPQNGYAHMRDTLGNFIPDFDPFKSGGNHHYVEGNSWQLTFFAPQDVPELIKTLGQKNFVDRLDWGFRVSDPLRFNAPNDLYWDYPVVQGNQQSMHFAFLFNWAKKPWLTQKWSRAIMDKYYGTGTANAYLGDEDQGQMSSWFVMAALGLFQTDGGCSVNPVYEIASPLFEKAVINLGGKYGRGETFTIEARNTSRKNKYVQSAVLNGKELNSFKFPASELLQGGSLILEMGPEPNESWGIAD